MFALLAAIVFAVWFVLELLVVDVSPIILLALGLCLLAVHFVPAVAPWRRG